MAGVDVSAAVSLVADNALAVAAVGGACLLIWGGLRALDWLKVQLGGGGLGSVDMSAYEAWSAQQPWNNGEWGDLGAQEAALHSAERSEEASMHREWADTQPGASPEEIQDEKTYLRTAD